MQSSALVQANPNTQSQVNNDNQAYFCGVIMSAKEAAKCHLEYALSLIKTEGLFSSEIKVNFYKALQLDPHNHEAYVLAGNYYFERAKQCSNSVFITELLGNYKKSSEMYTRAINLKPDCELTVYEKNIIASSASLKSGQYDYQLENIIHAYSLIIKRCPENPTYIIERSNFRYQLSRNLYYRWRLPITLIEDLDPLSTLIKDKNDHPLKCMLQEIIKKYLYTNSFEFVRCLLFPRFSNALCATTQEMLIKLSLEEQNKFFRSESAIERYKFCLELLIDRQKMIAESKDATQAIVDKSRKGWSDSLQEEISWIVKYQPLLYIVNWETESISQSPQSQAPAKTEENLLPGSVVKVKPGIKPVQGLDDGKFHSLDWSDEEKQVMNNSSSLTRRL